MNMLHRFNEHLMIGNVNFDNGTGNSKINDILHGVLEMYITVPE